MIINSRIYVAIRVDEIQPAVIVIIEKAGAPFEKRNRNFAKAGLKREVSEVPLSVVVIQDVRVVGEICNMETQPAAVVIVTNRHAHARLLAAILVQRNT